MRHCAVLMSTPNQSSLCHAWETHAQEWLAWTRHGHDSFDRFHREQFLALVPAPGRLTLDVGCGEGRLGRILKAAGHTVVGFDDSPILVDAARKADPSIPVHLADAGALPLADAEADLAIAFMCLHDFDDLDGAVHEIARVLAVDGRLCLAIVHPINSAGRFSSSDSDSPFTINGPYLGVHRYSDHIGRDGLTMTYHSCHRPLEHYITALQQNELVVEVLREPAVPEHAVRDASDRRWQRLPLFLHVRARADDFRPRARTANMPACRAFAGPANGAGQVLVGCQSRSLPGLVRLPADSYCWRLDPA